MWVIKQKFTHWLLFDFKSPETLVSENMQYCSHQFQTRFPFLQLVRVWVLQSRSERQFLMPVSPCARGRRPTRAQVYVCDGKCVGSAATSKQRKTKSVTFTEISERKLKNSAITEKLLEKAYLFHKFIGWDVWEQAQGLERSVIIYCNEWKELTRSWRKFGFCHVLRVYLVCMYTKMLTFENRKVQSVVSRSKGTVGYLSHLSWQFLEP